jgi:hypothetical protein
VITFAIDQEVLIASGSRLAFNPILDVLAIWFLVLWHWWVFKMKHDHDIRETVARAFPGRDLAQADRFLRWLDRNGYTRNLAW